MLRLLCRSVWIPTYSFEGGTEQQVCDLGADYFLGMEEYSETIHRHVERRATARRALSAGPIYSFQQERNHGSE
jgi:hypothetical protein